MKKVKSSFLSIMLIVFSINSFARDVISTGTDFVKVTKIGNLRRFELCSTVKKRCDRLGRRDYKISELQTLQTILAWETAGSSVASVLGIACAGMGVVAGSAAVGGAGLFAAGADLVGAGFGMALIGGSVGGTALAITSKYNPVSLYGRLDSVRDEVIEDKTVSLEGGNSKIRDFAETLDEALKSI
jgi:hypothetical protein